MLRPTLALACLAFLAAPARAASSVPTDVAREARELYGRGERAFGEGRWSDAEASFREVYLLVPAPDVVFDIAITLEKQRKWGDAADAYQSYLDDSKKVRDRKRIESRIVELRARVERQKEASPGTSLVEPQGNPGAAGNRMLPLVEEPGELRGREAASAPAVAQEAAATPVYKKWWLWVIVAGGAAVVAGAIAGGVVASSSSAAAPEPTTFPDFGPAAGPAVRF